LFGFRDRRHLRSVWAQILRDGAPSYTRSPLRRYRLLTCRSRQPSILMSYPWEAVRRPPWGASVLSTKEDWDSGRALPFVNPSKTADYVPAPRSPWTAIIAADWRWSFHDPGLKPILNPSSGVAWTGFWKQTVARTSMPA